MNDNLATHKVDSLFNNDNALSTGGGSSMKTKNVMLALVALLIALAAPSFAKASTLKANDTCPAPFATGYVCDIQPAAVKNSSSSHVHIVVKKTVTDRVQQYEKVNHVVVLINVSPTGVGSHAGCIDPVAKGIIHPGDAYDNSGGNHSGYYPDNWVDGRQICNSHQEKIGDDLYLVGYKDNCKNRIRIHLQGPRKIVVTIPVVEMTSVRTFNSTYDRWVTKTSTSSTLYYCVTPGYTLTYINGVPKCFKATQVVVVTPPPGPSYVCTINGVGVISVPNGWVNINGVCQQQTTSVNCPGGTNANGSCVAQATQATCDQQALNYPNSTHTFASNTCLIIQQVGNCSNQIIIVGNGSPNVTQGSNCNTAPPTPTPTPYFLIVGELPTIQEVDVTKVVNGQKLESTRRVCSPTFKATAGDPLSFTWDVQHGTLRDLPPNLTATGSDQQVCATYVAGTEAVTETLSFDVFDTKSTLHQTRTKQFPLVNPPAPPA